MLEKEKSYALKLMELAVQQELDLEARNTLIAAANHITRLEQQVGAAGKVVVPPGEARSDMPGNSVLRLAPVPEEEVEPLPGDESAEVGEGVVNLFRARFNVDGKEVAEEQE